ncbi:MAG: Ig-like domain-containing protein [Armatimonadota bacterium]|nr:Ig-like domain-containing protein [Armatimonadota bacterium]MDR7444865.1 Ig-like domain-containing protein [Armatimonadota bacterium]MDR7570299.1 Ig-like domain-containing protein [Armatimonadota bacterium]MDR7613470.1 Ig-like domain-containing protein [Armatimonadota bacterium]
MRGFWRLLPVLLAVFLSSGCGLLSLLAATNPPPAPTPTPTTSPISPAPQPFLQVVSTVPRDGETGVSPLTEIVVIFSDIIRRTTACLSITIEPPPLAGPTSCTLTSGGTGVRLGGLRLANNATYTVTVEPGVETVDGRVLLQPYTWRFTTRPPSAPVTVVLGPAVVGTVCSNGAVSPVMVAGDDESPNTGPCNNGGVAAAFVAFRVPAELGAPGVSVVSAVYTGQRQTVQGNPWGSWPNLWAHGVAWLDDTSPGILAPDDFFSSPLASVVAVFGGSQASTPLPFSFDATPLVRAQLQKTHIGIRFVFTTSPNGDGNDDLEQFFAPSIQVTYTTP